MKAFFRSFLSLPLFRNAHLSSSSFPTVVFNLTEGIDIAESEAKLTRHAAENASSIAAHAAGAAERARLAEKAEKAEEAGEEQPAKTTAAAHPPPPPMYNQPPPMPFGLPPEPLAASIATDATLEDATETETAAPFAASGGAPKTPQDYLQMGAASGWDSKGARRRGIAEAFRSLFAF